MGCYSSNSNSGLETLHPSGEGGQPNSEWSNLPGFKNYENAKQAIGTKGRTMSIERAAKGANPYYQGGAAEFTENCQRAVVAYEMRRRGYDVIASPTYKGDILPTTAFVNSKTGRVYKRYMGAFKNAKSEMIGAKSPDTTLTNIENKMKSFGDGARATLAFGWKRGKTGHVINVEYKNGKVQYVDAQVGGKYTGKELMKAIKTETASLTRTDNLKISDRIKNSVEQKNRRR